MVDRNWTKRVAKTASSARERVHDTVNRGATLARGVGGAVGDAAAAVPELIRSIEGPRLPLRERWGVGLGQVLNGHPGLPENLRGVVSHLDRLGHVQISPDAIGFDGGEVRWEKVEEIRFGPALDLLTSQALQHEAERLTSLLPPVPGRKWLVQQAVGVLAALCLAVAGPEADADPETGGEPDNALAAGIPVSVAYRSLARRKDLTPGIFAALVAASTPGISEAIVAIAQERGIKVTIAPAARSRAQALAMRRMAAAVADRLGRKDGPLAVDSGDDRSVE